MNTPPPCDAKFACDLMRVLRTMHNPITLRWAPDRWQRVESGAHARRNPLEILVRDGEDLDVVLRGVLGDEL